MKPVKYIYSKDNQAGRYIIRGKVVEARAYFWIEQRLANSVLIPEDKWPYQINNMTLWWLSAYRLLRIRDLEVAHQSAVNEFGDILMDYIINDGEGAKSGRGSNQNKFTFRYAIPEDKQDQIGHDVRIEVLITTVAHAQISQAKIKAERKAQMGLQEVGDNTKGVFFQQGHRTDKYKAEED